MDTFKSMSSHVFNKKLSTFENDEIILKTKIKGERTYTIYLAFLLQIYVGNQVIDGGMSRYRSVLANKKEC